MKRARRRRCLNTPMRPTPNAPRLRAPTNATPTVSWSTTATTAPMTATTQKVTWVVGACGGRDRVADWDGVVVSADEDFADDESQDSLLAGDVELVEAVGETAEEAVDRVGELEVGGSVVQFGVEAVELGL